MRDFEYTTSGKAPSNAEGDGSSANGSARTKRPCSTTAVNAPQWQSDGNPRVTCTPPRDGPGRSLSETVADVHLHEVHASEPVSQRSFPTTRSSSSSKGIMVSTS